MRIVILFLVVSLSVTTVRSQDAADIDKDLLFLSTFDDTTDVNFFGADNDAGWIYTAESPQRIKVLMHNRCPTVSIAKGNGKIRDSLFFKEKSEDVLFYQASSSLPEPQHHWAGTVSFWLKPNLERLGNDACYPVQIGDGDWNHGGFFVRFKGKPAAAFEFGAVSTLDANSVATSPDAVTKEQAAIVTIDRSRFENDKWTLVTITFENVNPNDQEPSIATVYLNGKLEGQIRHPLHIKWMTPETHTTEPNAAIFLGINYIGGIDELRIYERALTQPRIQMLYDIATSTVRY